MPATQEMIDQTTASVERMQQFDVSHLPRADDFGKQMAFPDAVEPAEKLISLYKKINLPTLAMMPQSMLQNIQTTADNDYGLFDAILTFTAAQGPTGRDSLVGNIVGAYDSTFDNLVQAICFGFAEKTDFEALGNNARTALQGIETMHSETKKQMEGMREESQKILADIRDVAAEQGVSQQAMYFQEEAKFHSQSQSRWLMAAGGFAVVALSWLLGWEIPSGEWSVAVASAVATKALIFSLLAYAVLFCVKNYTAHRHNYVVNTHRQKALLTYRSLVNAANFEEGQDIVLTQAARCIFEQRDTGYAKSGGNDGGNIVNFSPMETARKVAKVADED